jgi:hypothetical protein
MFRLSGANKRRTVRKTVRVWPTKCPTKNRINDNSASNFQKMGGGLYDNNDMISRLLVRQKSFNPCVNVGSRYLERVRHRSVTRW